MPEPTNKPPKVKPATRLMVLPFLKYPMAPPKATKPPNEKFKCAEPGAIIVFVVCVAVVVVGAFLEQQ
jgi:hypothetical protein